MTVPNLNSTELLVISALGSKERYGLEIADEVARISGGRQKISLGGLYTLLHRMDAKGLVAARWGATSEERQGARRRYYRVTALGARAARETKSLLQPAFRLIPKLDGGRA